MACVLGSWQRVEADVRQPKRDGHVRCHGERIGATGVGVDAGRQIDRDDLRWHRALRGVVEAMKQFSEHAPDWAAASDAEQRIDHHLCAIDRLLQRGVIGVVAGDERCCTCGCHEVEVLVAVAGRQHIRDDVCAPLGEVARRDEAIAAIVAGADEHENAAPFDDAEA